jgi:hypothetical protein
MTRSDSFSRPGIRAESMLTLAIAALALSGCKGEKAGDEAPATVESAGEAVVPTTGSAPAEHQPPAASAAASELDRLLAWVPNEPFAVAYHRLGKRLDPATLAVVFGIPPKAGHVLDERGTLDDALALVFEGESEVSNWLAPTSFAFTVALSRSPYFVRPLSKPAAEVGPLLQRAGFTNNTIDGVELWLPSGSFPWRIALLEGDVAAFIPIEVPGAGLEPLVPSDEADTEGPPEAAPPNSAKTMVEAELRRTLTDDPMIELVLISSGPLVHFDVAQPIAQVQFALRRSPGETPGYEGQIVLTPTGDADECANDLRARKYPEENQQVQALLTSVEFVVIEGAVIGRLAIAPDQLKHFLLR